MTLRLHPSAIIEVRDAFDYYDAQRPGLGGEFTASLDAALEEVESTPFVRPIISHGCRRRMLHRFPYAVVYLAEADEIVVYAVMHLRRKPGYWTDRIGT